MASDVKAKSVEVAASAATSAKDLVNKAADAATTIAKACDLKCFKECLELKNFAPYDVVETCVTKKCSCDVQIKSPEALQLMSAMDLSSLERPSVGFFGFIWRFSFLCCLGVGLFFGLRKFLEYLD